MSIGPAFKMACNSVGCHRRIVMATEAEVLARAKKFGWKQEASSKKRPARHYCPECPTDGKGETP